MEEGERKKRSLKRTREGGVGIKYNGACALQGTCRGDLHGANDGQESRKAREVGQGTMGWYLPLGTGTGGWVLGLSVNSGQA